MTFQQLWQNMADDPAPHMLVAFFLLGAVGSFRAALWFFRKCTGGGLIRRAVCALLGVAHLGFSALVHFYFFRAFYADTDNPLHHPATLFYSGALVALHALAAVSPRQPHAESDDPPQLPAGPAPRRVGFWDRVGSYLMGHFIFSMLSGAIGFWAVAKYFSYALAAILALMGWDMIPPDSVKEEAQGVIAQAKAAIHEEKEEALEVLHDKRQEIKPRKLLWRAR